MATGFAKIQRNTIKSTTGYKTLFEKVTEKTGGEKKPLSWYRAAVKSEASTYKKNFQKYILNERSDRVGAVQDKTKMNYVGLPCRVIFTCLNTKQR